MGGINRDQIRTAGDNSAYKVIVLAMVFDK